MANLGLPKTRETGMVQLTADKNTDITEQIADAVSYLAGNGTSEETVRWEIENFFGVKRFSITSCNPMLSCDGKFRGHSVDFKFVALAPNGQWIDGKGRTKNGSGNSEKKKLTMVFTIAQVTALCGGELPNTGSFDWKQVEYFRLKEGVLCPYAGSQVLPYPGIRLEIVKSKKCLDLLEPYDWWNYSAPVVPPNDVIETVEKTGRWIDWNNSFWSGTIGSTIYYRTRPATAEEDEDGFITHVLPGSYQPAKGWLCRFQNLNEPLPEWVT